MCKVKMHNLRTVDKTKLLEMTKEGRQLIWLPSVDIAQRKAEYKMLQADLECINQNYWV